MTHRAIRSNFQNTLNTLKGVQTPVQKFDYLLAIDFEATCEKDVSLQPPEIIEFPCVALCTHDWQVKNVFHEYVKPRVNPILTPFCIKLTGILQDMVDDQSYFPETFDRFCSWLTENGYAHNDNSAFVTCGDWDLKVMLPNQGSLDGVAIPAYFNRWINLKRTFSDTMQRYPRSLRDMLGQLDLPLEGRLHSGIADSLNMVRVMQSLALRHNAEFKVTTTIETSS